MSKPTSDTKKPLTRVWITEEGDLVISDLWSELETLVTQEGEFQ